MQKLFKFPLKKLFLYLVERVGEGEYAYFCVGDGGDAFCAGGDGCACRQDVVDKKNVLALQCLGCRYREYAVDVLPTLLAVLVRLRLVGHGALHAPSEDGDTAHSREPLGYKIALVVTAFALLLFRQGQGNYGVDAFEETLLQ